MTSVSSLASVARLVGEPARTAMLVTLMDGRALTASELGSAAGVAASTASGHLAQLLDAGLLTLERQGRHRYYRLANAAVAATLEQLMALSGELDGAIPRKPVTTGPRDRDLRRARLCYDHLAGEVAVGIADAMTARGLIDLTQDGGVVTAQGLRFLGELGVADLSDHKPAGRRATFCRPCLDWSERRPHIGGRVGRALYATLADQGWLRRPAAGRRIEVTPVGAMELDRWFGVGRC